MKTVSIEKVVDAIEQVLDKNSLEIIDTYGDLMRLEFVAAVISTLEED